MKFGKHIQKKQLDIPEYAASFVDYKALKKLIKELKNSPVTRPESYRQHGGLPLDPQSALQANKAPFFFRLDRELDKVNAFYQVKEEESRVRLKTLADKQKSMRMRNPVISRTSTHYITLEQGFRDFIKDLGKLQQYIEINATAFSKILKKWDKSSKSQTKELYLSRAVEIQPCFNHDMISELSDQANTILLDCTAWAEGEGTLYDTATDQQILPTPRLEQDETDSDMLDALNRGDIPALKGLISHIESSFDAGNRLTRAFLSAVSQAPEAALRVVLQTNRVDLNRQDEINDRNCLHKAAMAGRSSFLKVALASYVDPTRADAYGRIPLHYACMNGHVELIKDLIDASPATVETQDLSNFTPLIHAIVNGHLQCVETLLAYSARINPDIERENDHIPLNLACQYGSVPIVALLLREGPEIRTDAEGLYPQHLVAKFGRDPQLLLMLQDYGADLDQPDKLYQWTPLFHAASEGRIECLRELLACGVNVSARDEKGLSAQYYATWEGHLECMATLAAAMSGSPMNRAPDAFQISTKTQQTEMSTASVGEVELIPDLSLPPPILPTRRYGHNFLETKTTVVISFEDSDRSAVTFYDASKYPAARLTVVPKSPDIIPRNILLPTQEEHRSLSFEMDNLGSFAVDFDVYPTFGKKVIAKGSVPAEVFQSKRSSSGYHHLALLDPRLRSVGEIRFKFQVIKPFSGVPLEVTPFATYWKATSQFESGPNALVTGSSLSGEYVRMYVQLTRDDIPILYPQWTVITGDAEVAVIGLTYEQFTRIGDTMGPQDREARIKSVLQSSNIPAIHQVLAASYTSLENALAWLPFSTHIELHVLYPNEEEEDQLRLGPTKNMNDFIDSLLKVVLQHARRTREVSGSTMRSIVFTSFNRDVCTALNWKQPNYPILLCNDIGAPPRPTALSAGTSISSSGRTSMSIKEAVRIAQSNNFMGLICRSEILDMVPALVESIKVAGLVLVTDRSGSELERRRNPAAPVWQGVQEGVDGVLVREGVLRFNETIEM